MSAKYKQRKSKVQPTVNHLSEAPFRNSQKKEKEESPFLGSKCYINRYLVLILQKYKGDALLCSLSTQPHTLVSDKISFFSPYVTLNLHPTIAVCK
jgi:hypothetical protein